MSDGSSTLCYQLPWGDSLVVRRLLTRDGFAMEAPDRAGVRSELSVLVESDGRAARVREVMARWAPEATQVRR